MSETTNVSKGLSPEEQKAKRAELMKFYKEHLPLLRLEREYEECLTAIEEAKITKLQIMIAKAEMMNGPKNQPQQEAPGKQPEEFMRPVNTDEPVDGKRSLKKEKDEA